MRCILGLCVALAIGISSWAANTCAVASEAEFQTTGTPVVQPPATNAVQAATSVYQGATAQPATTPTLPATNMMPAGTYTAPMQPTTMYAAPGTTMTYPVYTYRAGTAGTLYQTTTPVYTPTAAPATTTYGMPVQGYTTMQCPPRRPMRQAGGDSRSDCSSAGGSKRRRLTRRCRAIPARCTRIPPMQPRRRIPQEYSGIAAFARAIT
jgi:hypothetical protein